MKIKKIIKLCTDAKRMCLYRDKDGWIWISDGTAIYPLEGFPDVSPDALCDMYDVSESKRKKMCLLQDASWPVEEVDMSAAGLAEEMETRLIINGNVYVPYKHGKELNFVDEKYLNVYDAEDQDYLKLYARETENGTRYFVIKIGMITSGFYCPDPRLINENFCTALHKLDLLCIDTLEAKQNKK